MRLCLLLSQQSHSSLSTRRAEEIDRRDVIATQATAAANEQEEQEQEAQLPLPGKAVRLRLCVLINYLRGAGGRGYDHTK